MFGVCGCGFVRNLRPLVAWIFFAGVLALWQAGSSAGVIDSLFLPSPARIAVALQELIASGDLFRHLGASLARIGLGWLIGAIAGVILGGLIGLSSLGPPAR